MDAYKITSNYENIDWEKELHNLLPVLMAFAYNLIGNSTLSVTKSKADLAYDFSMETIKRYLEKPEKFNPERNPDLVKYLKYNILRQLIYNFKKSKSYSNEDIIDEVNYKKLSNLYVKDYLLDDQIDYDDLIKLILSKVDDDPLLKEIFSLRVIKEYKRNEVCEHMSISSSEYDNAYRRLKNIVKKCITSKVETS